MVEIKVTEVLKEGLNVGIKNAPSLIVATLLWILTIWIPYINVGTTIAMCSIPVSLSKGEVLSPTFIFDAKFRKKMGDFFILEGLMNMAVLFAMVFLIIPAYVLSYAWSQAIYLLLDKEITSTEALTMSNKLTYGYKWKLFGIDLLISICIGLAICVLGGIAFYIKDVFGVLVYAIILILSAPFMMGCHGVIYRLLTTESQTED